MVFTRSNGIDWAIFAAVYESDLSNRALLKRVESVVE